MWNRHIHGLRPPREEIAFTARPKIHSHSQIFRSKHILSITSANYFRYLWFMPSLGVRSPWFKKYQNSCQMTSWKINRILNHSKFKIFSQFSFFSISRNVKKVLKAALCGKKKEYVTLSSSEFSSTLISCRDARRGGQVGPVTSSGNCVINLSASCQRVIKLSFCH